jgi:hypothetical protein
MPVEAPGSPFVLTVTGFGSAQNVNRADVKSALRVLADPDAGVELRGLPSGRSLVRKATDHEGLADAAEALNTNDGIYYCLNPVKPDIGDRGATVADVLYRRWVPIDVDPVKPDEFKDASATNEEKEGARKLTEEVFNWLADRGFPAPVVVDSGNGWHLLYKTDLPNNDASRSLVRRFLYDLAARFNCDSGRIDKSVSNASRIMKLPGTWARKGASTRERPHRQCRLQYAPADPGIVTDEMLDSVIVRPDRTAETPSPFTIQPTTSGAAAYAAAALENEATRVRLAVAGTDKGRNNSLNRAAYSLGQLVAAGLLAEAVVVERLTSVASDRGLEAREIEATIRSGLEAGKKEPRAVAGFAPLNGTASHQPLPKQNLPRILTLPELLATHFPPPNWAIPGLMSEGLTILAGKPKLGKSWLALNMALTIAGGGMALGTTRVEPGDVLYLSLEDRWRRIKDRARKVLDGLPADITSRLSIAVEWSRQDAGGLEEIDKWLKGVERPALVIVDVWAKFRPASKASRSAYDQDYEHVSALKALIDSHSTSGLVVHHCKKAAAEDALEEISGTNGLAGAADGVMVLTRARTETDAELFLTGRDIQEAKLALTFDPKKFVWTSEGNADERTEGKLMGRLLEVFKKNVGSVLGVGDLANTLKLHKDKEGAIRQVLIRMWQDKGWIEKVGAGRYKYPVQTPDCSPDSATF